MCLCYVRALLKWVGALEELFVGRKGVEAQRRCGSDASPEDLHCWPFVPCHIPPCLPCCCCPTCLLSSPSQSPLLLSFVSVFFVLLLSPCHVSSVTLASLPSTTTCPCRALTLACYRSFSFSFQPFLPQRPIRQTSLPSQSEKAGREWDLFFFPLHPISSLFLLLLALYLLHDKSSTPLK